MPLTHKDLTDILKADREINFVAFCVTPWHAISIRAALMKLQSNGVKLKGIILADKRDFENPSPLIDLDSFSILNGIDYKTDYFAGAEFPHGKISNLKRRMKDFRDFMKPCGSGRTVYILNPLSVNSLFVCEVKKSIPDARVISVITDEGIGAYMRSVFNWAVDQYKLTNSKSAFLRTFINNPVNKFYQKTLLKRDELIDCRMLTEDKGFGFEENAQMTAFYRKAVGGEKLDPADFARYEGAVVISTQPYHNTGQIKNDCDLKLYSEIISLLKKEGKTVIIKPHPRDNRIQRYDSLGCFVEKKSTASQESIFGCLEKKPAAVISFTSTGLITARVFCEVRGISANRLLPRSSLENSVKNEFSNFEKAFSNMVYIPKSTAELVEYIMKSQ